MNLPMTDDAIDLAAARQGDATSLARLYDRHAGVVLSWCRRRDIVHAEDVAQETFIRAFARLDQLADGADLRPWLYAIARRVCSEHLRAARRRQRHEERAMTAAVLDRPRPASAGAAAENREALDRLTVALDSLPDDERLAIHLYYLESDPAPAACAALNLSRSGFYKLLNRARERLALLMKEALIP